jgi:hypothetical protein
MPSARYAQLMMASDTVPETKGLTYILVNTGTMKNSHRMISNSGIVLTLSIRKADTLRIQIRFDKRRKARTMAGTTLTAKAASVTRQLIPNAVRHQHL